MSSQKIYGLCGLKHHIVDIRDHVTRRDGRTTNNEQGKIGLLSQWKLEAEFRKNCFQCVGTKTYTILKNLLKSGSLSETAMK